MGENGACAVTNDAKPFFERKPVRLAGMPDDNNHHHPDGGDGPPVDLPGFLTAPGGSAALGAFLP